MSHFELCIFAHRRQFYNKHVRSLSLLLKNEEYIENAKAKKELTRNLNHATYATITNNYTILSSTIHYPTIPITIQTDKTRVCIGKRSAQTTCLLYRIRVQKRDTKKMNAFSVTLHSLLLHVMCYNALEYFDAHDTKYVAITSFSIRTNSK